MDSRMGNRLAALTCLELVLMRRGNTDYNLVVAKLGSQYNCSVIDCFEHPDYLRIILKGIYKEDYPQIVDEVRVQLDELASVGEIDDFLKNLADGSTTDR